MYAERSYTIQTIDRLKIPKSDVAKLAGVVPGRVTDYLKHRPLPAIRCARIEEAVNDVAAVWDRLHPFRIEISDPAVFRLALARLDLLELMLACSSESGAAAQ